MVLRTPFKPNVLQKIYERAQQELGGKLISAGVSAYQDPREPAEPVLLLSIAADIDGAEFSRVHKAIAEAIVTEASAWSDAEKSDYREYIRYELLPLKALSEA